MDPIQMHSVVEQELKEAHSAREQGNEGRARVCARRAAGWALAAHYAGAVEAERAHNALEMLRWVQTQTDLSPEVRQAAERLTVHVTPEHTLPHEFDPLQDALLIIRTLHQKGT